MIEFLIRWVAQFPPECAIALLAALPVTESRASIPIGLFVFDQSLVTVLVWSFLGNLLPLVLVYGGFRPLLEWSARTFPWIHRMIFDHISRLEARHASAYQRWGALFLFVFVAIPLPGSGVWTGSVLAVLFGMKPKWSIPAIVLGLVLSAAIVVGLTTGVTRLSV